MCSGRRRRDESFGRKGRGRGLGLALLVSGILALASAASGAPPQLFHSPGDDGLSQAIYGVVPNVPFTLHLYLDSGAMASSSGPCESGLGDELCGFRIELLAQGGLLVSSFQPAGDLAWTLDSTGLRVAGGDPVLGTLGVIKLGDLVIEGEDGASLDSGDAQFLDARLEMESLPATSVFIVPEPGLWTSVMAGTLMLLILGGRRRVRAQPDTHPGDLIHIYVYYLLRTSAYVFVVLLLSSSVLVQGVRAAEFVIDVTEIDRFYGEDNLYGEFLGTLISVNEADTRFAAAGFGTMAIWDRVAGSWTHTQKVDLPFEGPSVDLVLDAAWIAVSFKPPTGLTTGSVYLYRDMGAGYVLHSTLVAPDNSVTGFEVHHFGRGLEIEGDTLLVGAPNSRLCCTGDVDGPGFVFEYHWDGSDWVLVDHFAPAAEDGREFGTSIDLEGDRVIVGAPREMNSVPDITGAAYLYERSGGGWTRIDTFESFYVPGTFDDQRWGQRVAANTDEQFVVASENAISFLSATNPLAVTREDLLFPPGFSMDAPQGGSASFLAFKSTDPSFPRIAAYSRSDQSLISIARGSVGGALSVVDIRSTAPSVFGEGLAMTSTSLLLGHPGASIAGPNTGEIHAFDLVGGAFPPVPDEVLSCGDAIAGDNFGIAVASVDRGAGQVDFLVGAPGDRAGPTRKGAVYYFRNDPGSGSWDKFFRSQPDDLTDDAQYGAAVAATSSGQSAIGAPDAEEGGLRFGRVYTNPASDGAQAYLTPAAPEEGFGASVAMAEDRLVVGAPTAQGFATESGALYFYRWLPSQTPGASSWTLETRATGVSADADPTNEPSAYAALGKTAAISGEWIVIGGPADARDGLDAGAAWIYRDTGFGLVHFARLEAPVVQAGDRYGEAVAVIDEWAFVGAPGEDGAQSDAGAVHVFQFDGVSWNFMESLRPAPAQVGQAFGETLSTDGVVLFVGSTRRDLVGDAEVGATYVFRREAGGFREALSPRVHSSPNTLDLGGRGLAIARGFMVSGIEGDDAAAQDAGGAALYRYDAHVEVPSPSCPFDVIPEFPHVLQSPIDPLAGDRYGQLVAVSGDTLAVAEDFAEITFVDINGTTVTQRKGAVHLYRRTDLDEWRFEQTIEPPLADLQQASPVGNFGTAMSLAGDLLAVGANSADAAWVFERTADGWVERARVEPSDGQARFHDFGREGIAIATDGTLVVGASNHRVDAQSPVVGAGALYFFERQPGGAWLETAGPVFSSDLHSGHHFGSSLEIDDAGGRVVSTGDDGIIGGRNAYVLERSGGGWGEVAVLAADAFGATASFGKGGLDVDGNRVAIGDITYVHANQAARGAAFVFDFDGSTWSTTPEIALDVSGFAGQSDGFGTDVALDGDLLVVGAPNASAAGLGSPTHGILHVFGSDGVGGWGPRARLAPPDPTIDDFGTSVAISKGIVSGSSPRARMISQFSVAGEAYVMDLVCDDADVDGLRDDVDNCPFVANVDQADSDADGNGDVCQCGDTQDDGEIDFADADLLRAALVSGGGAISVAGQEKCSVFGPVDAGDLDMDGLRDDCGLVDWALIMRRASGASVPPLQQCSRAVP